MNVQHYIRPFAYILMFVCIEFDTQHVFFVKGGDIAVPYVTYVTLVTNVASRYYSRNARAVFMSKYRRYVLASSSHPILPYTHTHHPYPYP